MELSMPELVGLWYRTWRIIHPSTPGDPVMPTNAVAGEGPQSFAAFVSKYRASLED